MSSKYLHIVSFNIPYPPDYGGVIDIFFKLVALKEAGIRVILHCFAYGRHPSKELEEHCFRVHYYPRASGLRHFLKRSPYIVATRISKIMPEIILRDSFPVLLEGLHTTGDLNRFADGNRVILVRAHNIEHRYYSLLSRSEKGLFRKIFLITESIKLAGYERMLTRADHVLAISKDDTDYFNRKFGNAHFIPPFHRFSEVIPMTGKGSYILYHGNLGVAENSSIFLKLTREILKETSYRLIVAGKNPRPRFIKALAKYPRIELIPDPDDEKIAYLIRNAQVNLLVTEQSTGLKLKLLHALFAGRHCLVNTKMVKGTGLDRLCRIADTPMETIRLLDELMQVPFTDKEVRERKKALKDYSNRAGVEKILRIIA